MMSSTSDDRRERLRQKIGDNRIFGRSGEESILINSYYASLTLNQNSPANLILICGESGLGKTTLAEVLRSYAKEDDGFFIRGKFEQSSASGAANVPYAGITNAFREYCSLLEERGDDREEVVMALKREIHENDGSLLCDAIPSLRNIIRDTCSEESVDELASTKNRFHRLNYLLKKFIRVISSTGDPIIFLLDDMQWSDQGSLDLLKILASSAKSPFLFVFTYRPVPADHPFLQFIDSLETRNSVSEISLRGLSKPDVFQMVSGMLGSQGSSCRSLSDFLCRVMNGNPLLVRQQLISLLDDGLIHFEDDTDNLVWDMKKIQESNTVSSSLTITTLHKFKRLPVETQTALKICSCIGSTTDLEVLGILIREICQDDDIHYNTETASESVGKDSILPAIQEGLLTESCNNAAVAFIHDSVEIAAYSLLRANEQSAYHLRIGLILNTTITATTQTDYIFTVANQLARGRAHVQEKERIEVARVFVRAGDICKCSCAFREAHFFYGQAIRLFCNSDWIHYYQLVWDAYLNASEAARWCGAYEDGCEWLEILSTRTKGRSDVIDELNVLWVKVNLFASKGDLNSAIDVGLKQLGSLVGVRILQTNLKARTLAAMIQTRRLMRGETEKSLLKHPRMTCEKISLALRILNFLALLCAATNQTSLVSLICFKIIRLNIEHGISRSMPTAMAWYGVIHLYAGFPVADAVKYGRIALGLLEALNCHEGKAQVSALCHGMIFTFVDPSECVKPLHTGCMAGLEGGDVMNAMICAQVICLLSFHSGQPLAVVASTLEKFSHLMREYNTSTLLGVNLIYEQVVEKLTERLTLWRDRAVLSGTKLNGTSCSNMEKEHACLVQMMLAYFLDDYNLAWRASNELVCIPRRVSLISFHAVFYRFMIAVALMTSSSNKKALKKVARSCKKTINKISQESPINFKIHHELIEAEWAVYRSKFHLAEKYFSSAIELGSVSSRTHFEALAWERFGHYYLSRGKKDLGYDHLRRAHKLYDKWGEIMGLIYRYHLFMSILTTPCCLIYYQGARLKCEFMERRYKDLLV